MSTEFKYNIGDLVFCNLRHKGLGVWVGQVLSRNATGPDSVINGSGNEYEVDDGPWVIPGIQRVLVWEEEMTPYKYASG